MYSTCTEETIDLRPKEKFCAGCKTQCGDEQGRDPAGRAGFRAAPVKAYHQDDNEHQWQSCE
jgi:hypothetical protein